MPQELRLFVGTWNMGGAAPTFAACERFLALAQGSDLVALAFQEAHYPMSRPLSPEAVGSRLASGRGPAPRRAAPSLASRLVQAGAGLGGALAGAALLAGGAPLALVGLLAGGVAGALGGAALTDELESRAHLARLCAASLSPGGGGDAYTLLSSQAAGQMRLLLFRRSAAPGAAAVLQSWACDCGGMGVANKGGLGLSLELTGPGDHHCPAAGNGAAAAGATPPATTRVALLAAHLPAHPGAAKAAARCAALAACLAAGDADAAAAGAPRSPAGLEAAHALVFVFGDLNFRVTGGNGGGGGGGVDADAFVAWAGGEAAAGRAGPSLGPHDELAALRRAGRALADYDEGPLAFPPTYKLAAAAGGGGGGGAAGGGGGGDGDGDGDDAAPADRAAGRPPPYAASRAPSWTDRVLWRCAGGGGSCGGGAPSASARLTAYGPAFAAAGGSDHAPVMATFVLTLP